MEYNEGKFNKKYAGEYRIGGKGLDSPIRISYEKKPSFIQRLLTRFIFGWYWFDK